MILVECKLIDDCLAQKRMGRKVLKKPYRMGQRVTGIAVDLSPAPDTQLMALETQDGYVIPEPFLQIIGEVEQPNSKKETYYEEIEDAEIVEDKPSSTKEENKRIIKDLVMNSTKKNKFTSKFIFGGALLGGAIAMYSGKSKFLYAVVGAIGGGVLGNYVGNKAKSIEDEKTSE
jgi:hypothetical protein